MNDDSLFGIGVLLTSLVVACTSAQPAASSDQSQENGAGSGGASGKAGGSGGGTAGGGRTGIGAVNGEAGASRNEGGRSGNEGGRGGNEGGRGGNESGGGSAGKSGQVGTSPGQGGNASGSGGRSAQGGVPSAGNGDGQDASSEGGLSAPVNQPELITSGENAYWKEGKLTQASGGSADVTVSDSPQQDWRGFGGTFNEVGWSVLSVLSASERDRAIHLLFDVEDGARFVYGRVPIGASDYALDRYTLDENEGDYEMAKFSIERDQQHLIPYIESALAIRPDVHLWASPWTPPTWMKDGPFTTESASTSAFDGGTMKSDGKTLKAYALYLAKFVEAYGKVGLKIEAVHPQNEPNYATRYPSCAWSSDVYNTFVRDYLGPTFDERQVTAEIFLGTMSNADSGKDPDIISKVTGDPSTKKYIKGVGLQWNLLTSVSSLKSLQVPIVQTEHKCGNYRFDTGTWKASQYNPDKAPNDDSYAVESWGYIRDWIKAGANVYSAWNMVLDTAGKNLDVDKPWPQNALLTVDTTGKKLNITPVYYVFRHVSQYVDPGAKVLSTTGGDALAFRNLDGSIVTILFNSATTAKTTTLAAGGKKVQFEIPAQGWATVHTR